HGARALAAALVNVNTHLVELGAQERFTLKPVEKGAYVRIRRTIPSEQHRQAANLKGNGHRRHIRREQELNEARHYHELAPDEQLSEEELEQYRERDVYGYQDGWRH